MYKQNNKISIPFKALGNDTRLEILKLLTSGEKCVCDIYKYLDLAQNLVSHHLRILRNSGLIMARKDGKWVHYSLNKKSIAKLNNVINNLLLSQKKKQ